MKEYQYGYITDGTFYYSISDYGKKAMVSSYDPSFYREVDLQKVLDILKEQVSSQLEIVLCNPEEFYSES